MISKQSKIENIVFDFGGVLLDIDYQRTYLALEKLLKVNFDIDTLPKETQHALADFETGKINKETFIWNLQRLATGGVPIGQDIIKSWNAMLIGWDSAKFEFLINLRKNYKVFLLSNTNEIHLEWVYRDLKRNHGINQFDTLFFDKTYYSHLVGYKKPDQAIFQLVMDEQGLDASKTIFIDDLIANIGGAKSLGWNAYHHNPKEDLIRIFEKDLKLL